jgi:hypothetical protein
MLPENPLPRFQQPATHTHTPTLSQMNPLHALSILILSDPLQCYQYPYFKSSCGLFPSGLPFDTLYAMLFSPHTCHMPNAYLVVLGFIPYKASDRNGRFSAMKSVFSGCDVTCLAQGNVKPTLEPASLLQQERRSVLPSGVHTPL